jgi:serine/threonine-protein kinase
VSVVVSKGPDLVTVPNIHDDTITQALAALQAAGLDVTEQIGPPGATYATATVPAAGKEVAPGSQITLYAG